MEKSNPRSGISEDEQTSQIPPRNPLPSEAELNTGELMNIQVRIQDRCVYQYTGMHAGLHINELAYVEVCIKSRTSYYYLLMYSCVSEAGCCIGVYQREIGDVKSVLTGVSEQAAV